MKRIKVEKATTNDWPQMADWMALLSNRNNVDTDIFSYPATEVLKASNGKPIIFMPIQKTFFLESLAINPEASAGETASALNALFNVIEFEARTQGHGETYFLCADEQTCKFAEHQGLEKINLTLYRRKL